VSGWILVSGCLLRLKRNRGSGADEILADMRLLWRLSSSTCKVLIGEGERQDLGERFDLPVCCSNMAIASETGTLLEVVWFKSSRSTAIWDSSRSARRSMTRSIDERRRVWPLVAMIVGVLTV
jgi:hypothetical protein